MSVPSLPCFLALSHFMASAGMGASVLPIVLVALGGCSALRPALLRPTPRCHAGPVMQELGLATPDVVAKAEAAPTTPLDECEVWDSSCPPVASTLELLEWDQLSAQVAGFAGTASAREMLRSTGLPLPQTREGSQRLLAETREAWQIEQRLAKPLELRGFHELTASVTLAQKGGVLDGELRCSPNPRLALALTLPLCPPPTPTLTLAPTPALTLARRAAREAR